MVSLLSGVPKRKNKLAMHISKDPLHGKTLEAIVTELQAHYGWEELSRQININCFKSNPSVKSSLTFLRKTDWARKKVESLYLYMLRKRK
jgi:uncharacterized protein (DUF2132 family)